MHENYLLKQLPQDPPCSSKLAIRLAARERKMALDSYRKGIYTSIDDLLSKARKNISTILALSNGTTSKEVAAMTCVHITTARKRLAEMPNVECNKEKRPYIYSLSLTATTKEE